MNAFLDRYYPVAITPKPKSADGFRERAARMAGDYVQTRRSHSSMAKLGALLAEVSVSVNPDDSITIEAGEESRRFVEVEPFVFHEQDERGKYVFREGKDGAPTSLFAVNGPVFAATRSQWYDTSAVHLGLLGGCAAIFATALLYWPVIAYFVGGWREFWIRQAGFRGVLSTSAWLLSVASIGFVVGLVTTLDDPTEITFGIPSNVKMLLLIPHVCALLTAITPLGCTVAWYRRYWRLAGRLHYTLVALAGVAFTWFLNHWNLLKFGA